MAHPRTRRLLIRRALVRSRIKLRVLFALLDLGDASLADLSREARAKPAHIRGALRGDGVAFRRATSLVRLKLVRIDETYVGERVSLTGLGVRVAKAWRTEVARAHLGLPRHPHS